MKLSLTTSLAILASIASAEAAAIGCTRRNSTTASSNGTNLGSSDFATGKGNESSGGFEWPGSNGGEVTNGTEWTGFNRTEWNFTGQGMPSGIPSDIASSISAAITQLATVVSQSEAAPTSSPSSVDNLAVAASSSASPAAAAATTASGTSGDAGSTTAVLASDSDIAQTLISLHNAERADYGAGTVAWNDSLATYATNWADKCGFEHSGGPSGENLAAGTGSGYSVTDAFNSWAYENSSYTTPGFTEATGHFTQVVWKSTTTIGCAWVPCAAGTIFSSSYGTSQYLVCEYYPAGNIVGDNNQYFIDNVGSLVTS